MAVMFAVGSRSSLNRCTPLTQLIRGGVLVLCLQLLLTSAAAQKKRPAKQTPKIPVREETQLARLRDEYIKATKDYRTSLEKLLPLYETNWRRAEERLTQSKTLFEQGLISRRDLDVSERAVVDDKAKVDEVRKQMSSADTQIAEVLIEVQAEQQMAGRIPKGGLVRTTSFIRYNGGGPWSLAQVNTVDGFFRQKFGRALPIAVFGQGAIHNRWRLDH